jgi:phosphoribosylanthranilate isomerase
MTLRSGHSGATGQEAINRPVQVKICGLKRVDEAVACVQAGARAVGCVFYPPSPRYVGVDAATEIRRALPADVACVGVFVDEAFDTILDTAERTGITTVQLHGREAPELVARLRAQGLVVIKALFAEKPPLIDQAEMYPASAFLVECGRGALPGGNAWAWDWGRAAGLGQRHPLILAGGLAPLNAALAVRAARPDAVDVSSGVEASPGCKDILKVNQLIAAVAAAAARRTIF